LIYGVAREGWFVRFLEIRPARYLGKISYGLYVYHFPIIWFVAQTTERYFKDPYLKPMNALIALVTTVIVASLSYYLMERPILSLKDRFFSVRKPRSQEKTLTMPVDS